MCEKNAATPPILIFKHQKVLEFNKMTLLTDLLYFVREP